MLLLRQSASAAQEETICYMLRSDGVVVSMKAVAHQSEWLVTPAAPRIGSGIAGIESSSLPVNWEVSPYLTHMGLRLPYCGPALRMKLKLDLEHLLNLSV